MKYYLGVDFGGTNLRAAIVDTDSGKICNQRKLLTLAHEGQKAVMERLVKLIQGVALDSGLPLTDIGGVGIGVPGTPDINKGTILLLTNLPGQWRDVPLKAIIEKEVALPTALCNDVRAMTLSEWVFGAGRGADTLVCFAIGTGIGGGLVVNGQLHLGIGGTAGEFGHQVVEVNGPPCACGSRGCLELYASGPAIAAMGVKEVLHGHTTRIGELAGFDLNRITAKVVVEAARAGDKLATEILQRAGTYLGIVVGNVIGMISPQKVIFGGGVAQAKELLLGPVRQTVSERVHLIPLQQVEFMPALLGSEAGLVGAALWSKRRCEGL